MATDTRTGATTFADVMNQFMPGSGQVLEVVDILSEKLPIFREAHWVEANDYTQHRYLQTLSEPAGSDSIYNEGVAWELGLDSPVSEMIQTLESYSRVDVRILKDSPDPAAYRRDQDAKFVRGLGKSAEARALYGRTGQSTRTSVGSPSQILGIAARFNVYNSGAQPWNQIQGSQYWLPNVKLAGGSTAAKQSSAWLIKWADDGLFMIFPRGGKGTIEVEPMPQPVIITDSNGNAVTYEITHFSASFGIGVGDWRNVCRLANISSTDLKPWTSDLMLPLIDVLPDGAEGVSMYIGRKHMVDVRTEVKNNTNVFHFDDAPWGPVMIPYWMEIPLAVDDEITDIEAVVS